MNEVQIVGALALAAMAGGTVWMMVCIYENLGVQREAGTNDKALVVKLFEQLLRTARQELIIHDDGDSSAESIYNDQRIIDAIREALELNPELEIRIFFNDRERLLINDLLQTERLQIRYRQATAAPRPAHDVHYKIADGGRRGYLSLHDHGSGRREFQFFDCSHSKRMRKRLFGPYCDQFQRDFGAAVAA